MISMTSVFGDPNDPKIARKARSKSLAAMVYDYRPKKTINKSRSGSVSSIRSAGSSGSMSGGEEMTNSRNKSTTASQTLFDRMIVAERGSDLSVAMKHFYESLGPATPNPQVRLSLFDMNVIEFCMKQIKLMSNHPINNNNIISTTSNNNNNNFSSEILWFSWSIIVTSIDFNTIKKRDAVEIEPLHRAIECGVLELALMELTIFDPLRLDGDLACMALKCLEVFSKLESFQHRLFELKIPQTCCTLIQRLQITSSTLISDLDYFPKPVIIDHALNVLMGISFYRQNKHLLIHLKVNNNNNNNNYVIQNPISDALSPLLVSFTNNNNIHTTNNNNTPTTSTTSIHDNNTSFLLYLKATRILARVYAGVETDLPHGHVLPQMIDILILAINQLSIDETFFTTMPISLVDVIRDLIAMALADCNKPILCHAIPCIINILERHSLSSSSSIGKETLISCCITFLTQLSFDTACLSKMSVGKELFIKLKDEVVLPSFGYQSTDQSNLALILNSISEERYKLGSNRSRSSSVLGNRVSKFLFNSNSNNTTTTSTSSQLNQPIRGRLSTLSSPTSTIRIFITFSKDFESKALRLSTYLLKEKKIQICLCNHPNGAFGKKYINNSFSAIDVATHLIVLVSCTLKESIQCRKEVEYAYSEDKQVIFINVESGYIPNGWLETKIKLNELLDGTDDGKIQYLAPKLYKHVYNGGISLAEIMLDVTSSSSPPIIGSPLLSNNNIMMTPALSSNNNNSRKITTPSSFPLLNSTSMNNNNNDPPTPFTLTSTSLQQNIPIGSNSSTTANTSTGQYDNGILKEIVEIRQDISELRHELGEIKTLLKGLIEIVVGGGQEG
jgi:hypothetical protein